MPALPLKLICVCQHCRKEELNNSLVWLLSGALPFLENTNICFVFRDPRGFGFIQYFDPEDAADAKYHMDRQMFLGREITVVFAEENRKKPSEMRTRERVW